ncbi:MAG TPA: ATP-binding protein [Streptosporangiaceae bacterium]
MSIATEFPRPERRTARYAALPSAAGAARRETVQTLKDWGLVDLIDVAELLVSELVSNAVKATGTLTVRPTYAELRRLPTVTLELRRDRGPLIISVWDVDPTPPVVRDADEQSEGGRGLHLVQALSSRWGYYPVDDGKCVWCELLPRIYA